MIAKVKRKERYVNIIQIIIKKVTVDVMLLTRLMSLVLIKNIHHARLKRNRERTSFERGSGSGNRNGKEGILRRRRKGWGGAGRTVRERGRDGGKGGRGGGGELRLGRRDSREVEDIVHQRVHFLLLLLGRRGREILTFLFITEINERAAGGMRGEGR